MDQWTRLDPPDRLVVERLLPGPIERVWDYLTRSDLRQTWFCAGDVGQEPGSTIEFKFDHRRLSQQPAPEKYAGEQVVNYEGTVTVYEAPHRLAFTWPEGDAPDSMVTITLQAQGENVLLRLEHERVPGGETMVGIMAGWHAHLDLMGDAIAGRAVRDFWAHHMPLEDVYRERLAGG